MNREVQDGQPRPVEASQDVPVRPAGTRCNGADLVEGRISLIAFRTLDKWAIEY